MVGGPRIECATLRVPDRAETVAFYADVMGLVEVAADETTVYLGCGMDARYDLAVREGGTGIEAFAVRVPRAVFDDRVDRLGERGVRVERRAGPGHERGAYVELPSSGIRMGIVDVGDRRYHHPADATGFLDSTAPVATGRLPTTPRDLDHVGLVVPDVEEELRFLETALGFRVSDARVEDGTWQQAFLRTGDHYHDVALFGRDPRDTLHHLAWLMPDVATMARFADRLARSGRRLELGFVRHGPGASISVYFKDPGGNRFEYSTEQPSVDPDSPPGRYDGSDRPEGISLWGGCPAPEGFDRGS